VSIARYRTLWRLWRREREDPEPFYRMLAAEGAGDLEQRHGPLAGQRIVDLGCGNGLYSVALRDQHGAGPERRRHAVRSAELGCACGHADADGRCAGRAAPDRRAGGPDSGCRGRPRRGRDDAQAPPFLTVSLP
jgi:hypothetical protein